MFATNLFLLLLVGTLRGVGLLILIPIIDLLGNLQSTSLFSTIFKSTFSFFGIEPTLLYCLCLFIAVISLAAGINYAQALVSMNMQNNFMNSLRSKVLKQIINSRYEFHLEQSSGKLTHLLTTEVQRISALTNLSMKLLSLVFLTVAYIAFAFLSSVWMTIFASLFGCMVFVALQFRNKHAYKSGKLTHRSSQALFLKITEILSAIDIIKMFSCERMALASAHQMSLAISQENVNFAKIQSLNQLTNKLLGAFFFQGLLCLASTSYHSH